MSLNISKHLAIFTIHEGDHKYDSGREGNCFYSNYVGRTRGGQLGTGQDHWAIHSYDGKPYSTDQGWKKSLSMSMIQKMADAGLSYNTLQALYEKYGLNGLYGILALAPTTSRAESVSRVTVKKRILSMILRHFRNVKQYESLTLFIS